MAEKFILSDDEGARSFMVYDDVEDRVSFGMEQDVSYTLARNRALRDKSDRGWTEEKWGRRAASIPFFVIQEWKAKGINVFDKNDWPKVAALLDDPEYRHLRTADWKIGNFKRS